MADDDVPADVDADADADVDQQAWIPLDENPHADDKRDVLDPTDEQMPFKRLILIGLGIGLLVVALVVWLV